MNDENMLEAWADALSEGGGLQLVAFTIDGFHHVLLIDSMTDETLDGLIMAEA